MPQEISVTIKNGETVKLVRDGDSYQIFQDGEDTKKILKKGDTLVVKGDSMNSLLKIEDGAFIPRVKVETSRPLIVDGSMLLAGNSKQSVLIDLTPVELTKMQGLDVKKTEPNPKAGGENTPSVIMSHVLETPEADIMLVDKKNADFPEGAKVFFYPSGKLGLEKNGGRFDFINTKDYGQQLYTFQASDSMQDSVLRSMNTRNNAMKKVSEVLSSENIDKEDAFKAEKQKYGIPDNQLRGSANYKKAFIPNQEEMPAFVRLEDAAAMLPNITPRSEVKPDFKAMQKAIVNGTDKLFKDYPAILEGRRGGLQKEGGAVGKALQDAKNAASNLFNERTGEVNSRQLGKLHNALDTATENNEAMLKEITSNKSLKDVNDKAAVIKQKIDQYKRALNGTKELNQAQGRPAKKLGFMQSLVPEGMPKLAVADATEAPAPLAGALPRIEEFLKGKSDKGVA
jgi:hypothetical protein